MNSTIEGLKRSSRVWTTGLFALVLTACGSEPNPSDGTDLPIESPKAAGYRIYVTNARSGDLSVIDSSDSWGVIVLAP